MMIPVNVHKYTEHQGILYTSSSGHIHRSRIAAIKPRESIKGRDTIVSSGLLVILLDSLYNTDAFNRYAHLVIDMGMTRLISMTRKKLPEKQVFQTQPPRLISQPSAIITLVLVTRDS